MNQQLLNIYEFGPYRIDAAKRLLLRHGEVVPLTPKCFEIVLALVERSGEVVDKEGLMKRVWPDSFVEEGNLTYNISILRKALGERAGEHQYIVTVPGRGYQFVASVRLVRSDSSEQAVREQQQFSNDIGRRETAQEANDPRAEQHLETAANHVGDVPSAERVNAITRLSQNALAKITRHKLILIALFLTLVAFIGGRGYFRLSPSEQMKPISSMAVLPLANLSGDPDMEYLSDGISGTLINTLSQLPGIKVIARSSSFKYKGKEIDPKELASLLQVEGLVMGSINQRGDNILINVELMDVRDRTQIWGEQYNRKMANLPAVQAEISSGIASNLRLKLTPAEQHQLAERETATPQAYELRLKGRFYRNKGGTENITKAVDYLNQAIAVDPKYALAYAELSRTIHYGCIVSDLNPREFLPKATAAAQKALELDERLAEAHLVLAMMKENDWDWATAEHEYERAIQLNTNLALAHNQYASFLSIIGRHEEALAEFKRARELDPLSSEINIMVGVLLYIARQYDQGLDAMKKMIELYPTYPYSYQSLGFNYAGKGMFTEAIVAYREANRLGDVSPTTQIYLGAAYAKAGEVKKARAILKRLQMPGQYVSPAELAVLYTALNEREQAFASLERAYAAHDLQLKYLNADPAFDPLRSDPRFSNLLRRVGLPQ